ncbi:uncharacterized protein LOC142567746 [Dermacentor variabilis]|uniref:uncharacterized protein LOC142567746 n=1 Tax=Dermacentor variabilis TaxID=34621 RepID=UPI003F5B2C2B
MERLQKKQAALRQAIEKIIAAASDLLQSPTIQVGELEEHLDLILEQADELKSVSESIEKKIDLQELHAELEACAAYTEKICSIKTKIKRALRSQTANESRSTTPSVTGKASEQEAYHIGSVPPATFQPVSATTKLPKLEIGKFSGDLRSWQKFWNQFESTIHKNSTLPAIAKFQYLTSYLTGKAAAAIEGLPISDRNYDIAVKTLIERFGKEDVIIEDHMSRLLDVRPVHDLRDIERLRSLYDEIRSGVRSLEALGVSSSTYGTLLLTVLRKSIPKGHQPANCVAPVPMAKKKEVMSRERRCYKCAKKKHRATECRTARWLKCAKCSGRHATGVCELNQRPTHPPSIGDAAPAETAVQSSLQVGPALGKTRVLLQTARAYAEGQHNSALVRMLLDGGSQRTFVRQDVSRRLNLRVIGGEKLAIYAFGSERPSEERRCHRVECWLRNWRNNTRVRIEALEVPEICGDLLPPPDDSTASIAREQDLQLADTLPDGYHPGVGVELLIGADHYWDIATGNVKRLGEKLVAMETAFGWTLQGTESTSSVATFLSSTGVMRVGVTTAPDEISRQLRSFWELEHLGIVNDTQLTAKEDSVLRAFEETITQKNGRYQVALPWKENASDLTDNKSIASHRLHSLTAKLLRHEETVLDYDQAIRNYLQAGHAEEANELATLSHHLKTVQEKFPRTAKILSDNLYVDDLVTGADSVEEAERIIRESQSILKAAGMNLRKWRSNYPELIASFAETESAQKTLPELGPTKILGVEWRPDTDEFVFEMTALIGFLASRQDTKRFVLQASARIFDPFGFLSAITITAKIMFQSLWERGTAWDERVPSDLQETWDKCIDAYCTPEYGTRYPNFENATGLFEEDKPSNRSFDAVFRARGRVAELHKSPLPRFPPTE